MIYKVFNFKSLKLVLANTANGFIGYSVDTKYPEFSRPVIRGSAKDVVEVCIYLYRQRLLAAYNCEGYTVPADDFNVEDDIEVRDWVTYVLNRYLFDTFGMFYKHTYKKIPYTYTANDGTICSLTDYVYDGIAIKYWDDDEESW